MKRADNATRVQEFPDELIGHPAVPLDHAAAFGLLVALLPLARRTVERVDLEAPALFPLPVPGSDQRPSSI